jgi:hypothetical protein
MVLDSENKPCDICGDSKERDKGNLKQRVHKPNGGAKDKSDSVYYSHEYCFEEMKKKATAWNNPPEDKEDDPFNGTRKNDK